MATLLANRRLLTRRVAATFIMINFYRRLMLAVLILKMYAYLSLQVLSALSIQLVYLIFISNYRVYKERGEHMTEFINEYITLLTIYFLMCFTGEFIGEALTMFKMGVSLISLTSLNFLYNILILLCKVKQGCRNWCHRRKLLKEKQARMVELVKEARMREFDRAMK